MSMNQGPLALESRVIVLILRNDHSKNQEKLEIVYKPLNMMIVYAKTRERTHLSR